MSYLFIISFHVFHSQSSVKGIQSTKVILSINLCVWLDFLKCNAGVYTESSQVNLILV